MSYHQPVLAGAVVQALITDPGGTYVDATFGGGGHSRLILQRLSWQGRLIGIDRDPEAPLEALNDPRFTPIRGNFRHLQELLGGLGIYSLTGLLADLGVSSHQLNEARRGFSYRQGGPLDLRMDPESGVPAWAWLRQQSEESLSSILRAYGDLPKAGRLARALLCRLPRTTLELRQLVEAFYGPAAPAYLAQVFQALRIALNDELGALRDLLQAAFHLLGPGGRLVVLTYHSGEARPVKSLYQTPSRLDPLYGHQIYSWKLLQKIRPSQVEIQENPRSRSATLWVLERTGV